MCGIAAFAAPHTSSPEKLEMYFERLKMLMMYNQERGEDATGIAGLGKGWHKDTIKVSDYLARYNDDIRKYISNVMMAHSRQASSEYFNSKKNTNAAHPFYHKGLTLIHNGTVKNKRLIERWYENNIIGEKMKREIFVTDSQMLAYVMGETKDWKILSEYEGAANIIFTYDEHPNHLYFYKDPDKPLFYGNLSNEEDVIYVCSLRNALLTIGVKDPKWADDNVLYEIIDGKLVNSNGAKIARKPITLSMFPPPVTSPNLGYNKHDYEEDDHEDLLVKSYGYYNDYPPSQQGAKIGNRFQNDIKSFGKLAKNAKKKKGDYENVVTNEHKDGYYLDTDLEMYVRPDVFLAYHMGIDGSPVYYHEDRDEMLLEDSKTGFTGMTKDETDKGKFIYWLRGKKTTKENWGKEYRTYISQVLSREQPMTDTNGGCIVPRKGKQGKYWINGHLAKGEYKGVMEGKNLLAMREEVARAKNNISLNRDTVERMEKELKAYELRSVKHGHNEDITLIGKWFFEGEICKGGEEEFEFRSGLKSSVPNESEKKALENIKNKAMEPETVDNIIRKAMNAAKKGEETAVVDAESELGEEDIKKIEEDADYLTIVADSEQELYNHFVGSMMELVKIAESFRDLITPAAVTLRNLADGIGSSMLDAIDSEYKANFKDVLEREFTLDERIVNVEELNTDERK